jgi:hypothetical protein
MPSADPSPPASSQPGVAAIRLADRRQVFVEGVPPDLPFGAVIRLLLDGAAVAGTISIPPALVAWRDPDAHCATFLALERLPEPPTTAIASHPQALYLADGSVPEDATLAAMLQLAGEEMGRLDD